MRVCLRLIIGAAIVVHSAAISAQSGQFSQRSPKQEVKRMAAVAKLTPAGVANLESGISVGGRLN